MVNGTNFSTLIRGWRKSHKYSISDASKLLGVSSAMYCLYENGRNVPKTGRYDELSKLTHINIDEITRACNVSLDNRKASKELKKYNIKKNPSIVKTGTVEPTVVVPPVEPMPTADFDNLLKKYTDKLNEKERLMTEWLSIKDKLEATKMELVSIRDEIRRNA